MSNAMNLEIRKTARKIIRINNDQKKCEKSEFLTVSEFFNSFKFDKV